MIMDRGCGERSTISSAAVPKYALLCIKSFDLTLVAPDCAVMLALKV